jgi:hypothetical protein
MRSDRLFNIASLAGNRQACAPHVRSEIGSVISWSEVLLSPDMMTKNDTQSARTTIAQVTARWHVPTRN